MERLGELSFTGCPILLFSLKTTFILQDVCYQYWPSDDTKGVLNYGEFTVSVLQATKQNGFIQRHISITNPKVVGNGMSQQDIKWNEESMKNWCCTSYHIVGTFYD